MQDSATRPSATRPKEYNCTIEQVHSGDDMIGFVELGHDGLYKKTRMRLRGVDTPDAYKAKADTPAGKIREQVRNIVSGNQCRVIAHSEGHGGGWVVTLLVYDDDEWLNLNERLMEMGFVYQRDST